MKVVLCAVNSKFSHTNLAVRLINRFCNERGEVMEFTVNEPIESIVSRIFSTQPDVICFSAYIWNIEYVLKCAATLKKVLPHTIIIFGGPEVSHSPDEYMKYSFIDAIACGEGELTFQSLFENDFDFCDVHGMVYRCKDSIIHNEAADILPSLDMLPFPYSDIELDTMRDRLLYYESSRGCPYNCSYCLSSVTHTLRFASLDKVKKDLQKFTDKKVRIVKFTDRTFNADPERAYHIFEFLIQNGGSTRFHFEISAHILTKKILDLLKTAPPGLFQFEIGVQSTNNETIKAIDRKTDFPVLAANTSELLKSGNIHLHLDIIAGLPYEDLTSFIKSFNDVFALRPHMLQLGFLKLLKGTKIRREYALHDYKFTEYPPYEFLENKYMSFDDTLKLKAVENITDKYYNSGKFIQTINALLPFCASPYDMFREISEYFAKHGYCEIALSANRLYEILSEFIQSRMLPEYMLDCLKFDYFCYSHANTAPAWYNSSHALAAKRFDIIEKNRKTIFSDFGTLPAKEIVKHVIFEEFKYDVPNSYAPKRQLIIFFKNGGFKKMDLTPKDYIVKRIEGEYAVLENMTDKCEIFIALALLPPGTDADIRLHYENLEYTVI